MRILIVSTFFPPLNSIASLRPYSWAKEWGRLGHDVTVLTSEKSQDDTVSLKLEKGNYKLIEIPMPSYLDRVKASYSNKHSGTSKRRGMKSLGVYAFNWMRNRLGIFNACRMPDFADLWIKPALKRIKNDKQYDVVISTAGPYSVHILAYLIKNKGVAASWIADYRDTWSDNYFFPGLFPLNLVEKGLERWILRKADTITTVSEPLVDSFAKKYGIERTAVVPNGFDPEDLMGILQEPAFPEDDKYRIVHTGSIYLGRRDPAPLFQSIKDLSFSNKQLVDRLEVLFVGANNANLKDLIDKHNVGKWVKMVGFVSREKALAMQRDAHTLLFLPWNDPNVDGIVTGKIFEYFYAKTPIIAVGANQLEISQKMILEANSGKVFHKVNDITNFLIDELTEPKKKKSGVDDEYIKQFDRKVIAQNLLELIHQ